MKLRNKKTGEIGNFCYGYTNELCVSWQKDDGFWGKQEYNSLAELNEEWEDYEDELLYVVSAEHKSGYQCVLKEDYPKICKVAKELGIGFETEEECQKAVEKLKAWKRLKDNGFVINKWLHTPDMNLTTGSYVNIKGFIPEVVKNMKDLDLLFGGEE